MKVMVVRHPVTLKRLLFLMIPVLSAVLLLAALAREHASQQARAHRQALMNERLIRAAELGDLGGVKQLLAQGAQVNGVDYRQRTALFQAADYGQDEVVTFLLATGAKVNPLSKGPDYYNPESSWEGLNPVDWTPLRAAALRPHPSTVKTLLARGADPTTENDQGEPLLTEVKKWATADSAAWHSVISMLTHAIQDPDSLR